MIYLTLLLGTFGWRLFEAGVSQFPGVVSRRASRALLLKARRNVQGHWPGGVAEAVWLINGCATLPSCCGCL